jgi:prolyl-tRNA synthetase
MASVIIVHGDDKGLRFPWDIAPVQIAIVPITHDKKLLKKAEELKKQAEDSASIEIDLSEKTPGEKFNYWEMKGVPIRVDLGLKELKDKKITVFRRDLNKKETIDEKQFMSYVKKVSEECTKNLKKQAEESFGSKIKEPKSIEEMKNTIEEGGMIKCGFCSVEKDGEKCAEVIEKQIGAKIRGTKLEKEKATGKCVVCDKKAKYIVYIARDY